MANVRLAFGHRSANIGGRNTVVQGNVVDHQHNQAASQRRKLKTPGAAPSRFQVFANQGAGVGQSPKRIRSVGAECVYGPVSPPRRYKDVCEHTTGITRERVINKVRPEEVCSPSRNRPYGPSPAAAAIRPPTGSGGFAASVSPSLGSPARAKLQTAKPMPGTMASPGNSDRQMTAGFQKTTRGYCVAQQYHQDITAPAFAAKHRTQGPAAAIGMLVDFGNASDPGRSPASLKTNGARTKSAGVNDALTAGPAPTTNHRNTMGGVRPGGANYLNRAHRRRVVQANWNATTESQPHGSGMHFAKNHPLSPRRLCTISAAKAKEIETRNGAMANIMGHAHVDQ